MLTREYRHRCRIPDRPGGPPPGDPHCTRCGCGAVETVEHLLLHCLATEAQRGALLATPGGEQHGRSLRLVGAEPRAVLAFLHATGQAGFAGPRDAPPDGLTTTTTMMVGAVAGHG